MPATDRLSWVKWWPRDFLTDHEAMSLSHEALGIYTLILNQTALTGTPGMIPDDDRVLASMGRCDLRKWRKHREAIARCFNVSNGFWVQERTVEEHKQAVFEHQARVEAGQKSGSSRRQNGANNARTEPEHGWNNARRTFEQGSSSSSKPESRTGACSGVDSGSGSVAPDSAAITTAPAGATAAPEPAPEPLSQAAGPRTPAIAPLSPDEAAARDHQVARLRAAHPEAFA